MISTLRQDKNQVLHSFRSNCRKICWLEHSSCVGLNRRNLCNSCTLSKAASFGIVPIQTSLIAKTGLQSLRCQFVEKGKKHQSVGGATMLLLLRCCIPNEDHTSKAKKTWQTTSRCVRLWWRFSLPCQHRCSTFERKIPNFVNPKIGSFWYFWMFRDILTSFQILVNFFSPPKIICSTTNRTVIFLVRPRHGTKINAILNVAEPRSTVWTGLNPTCASQWCLWTCKVVWVATIPQELRVVTRKLYVGLHVNVVFI